LAVLSKGQILGRLNLPITDNRSLVISPLLQAKAAFDADSVDLRLGTHFLLPRTLPRPFFYPGSKSSKLGHQRVHVPLGHYLVVSAHETVLGSTLEFVKLPFDVSGQILTKSSVARTFVVIETAPWIHPEYRGCLTLEIANVSNTPLLLYPGRLVAQLILFDVPKAKPSSQQSGTYLGPVYPEAPTFREPTEDLAMIGVPADQFQKPMQKPKRQPLDRCGECQAKVVLLTTKTKCSICGSSLPAKARE
jgi:dCTP deaminase